MKPYRLESMAYPKPWGSKRLEPWFRDSAGDIGEVWFTPREPIALLVKLIFTSAKLSVQVHPNDTYAALHEHSRGKTEMWHILRADEGASIAAGFREAMTPARVRESALSGEIEKLLNWIPVKAGDTFLIPAGMVHAIGAGIVLCEVQQFSDVTYRLYDYGRPRELHLDKSMDVADFGPYIRQACVAPRLAECGYFVAERLDTRGRAAYHPDPDRYHLLVALSGAGTIDGEAFAEGECWMVPAGAAEFAMEGAASFLRAWDPGSGKTTRNKKS